MRTFNLQTLQPAKHSRQQKIIYEDKLPNEQSNHTNIAMFKQN